MSAASLRRFDVQARYALALSLVAVLPCAGALLLVLKNYDADLAQIVYGSRGRFLPALFACLGLSTGPAAVALLLGWNSAGERRNDRSASSWTGFFLGGTVLTIDAIIVLAFVMLRLKIPM